MTIYYNPVLKALARELRKNCTLAEILLWKRIKNKQFHGLDFHRQKPIGEYIVDFFCPKMGLIIEIDGSSHDLKQEEDKNRQAKLESHGYIVMRFLDSDVKTSMDGVLKAMEIGLGLG